jgi:hypothetical protein
MNATEEKWLDQVYVLRAAWARDGDGNSAHVPLAVPDPQDERGVKETLWLAWNRLHEFIAEHEGDLAA